MRFSPRHVVTLLLAVIAGAVAFHYVPEPLPEISREEFLAEVKAGHVPKVEIYEEEWMLSESTEIGPFRTPYDRKRDAGLADQLRAVGIEVWYSYSPPGI